MRKFQRGLVVGKFAPLHLGHELVIRTALDQCDQVFVISYSRPELPGCEPERRKKWLAELFPSARSIVVTDAFLQNLHNPELSRLPHNDETESEHRRFVARLCRCVFDTTVDAVFTSEKYGDGFAAELTEHFRRSPGFAGDVAHVSVDLDRVTVPISGSRLREDIFTHRRFLSPAVYKSFVQRICILGGESSGKSTLAASLATRFRSEWVAEYGRDLWVTQDGVLAYPDMLRIAQTQIQREEEASRNANRYLFCDTSPLTTLFYSRRLFGRADPALEQMAKRTYDVVVLCAPDFPFVQDGTRQPDSFREEQHRWYLGEFQQRHMPYLTVTGDVEQRVLQVEHLLQLHNQSG